MDGTLLGWTGSMRAGRRCGGGVDWCGRLVLAVAMDVECRCRPGREGW
jgi:hypothetical protein